MEPWIFFVVSALVMCVILVQLMFLYLIRVNILSELGDKWIMMGAIIAFCYSMALIFYVMYLAEVVSGHTFVLAFSFFLRAVIGSIVFLISVNFAHEFVIEQVSDSNLLFASICISPFIFTALVMWNMPSFANFLSV